MTYTVEDWGRLESIDDFVDKALPRILADKEESDAGAQESLWTELWLGLLCYGNDNFTPVIETRAGNNLHPRRDES